MITIIKYNIVAISWGGGRGVRGRHRLQHGTSEETEKRITDMTLGYTLNIYIKENRCSFRAILNVILFE